MTKNPRDTWEFEDKNKKLMKKKQRKWLTVVEGGTDGPAAVSGVVDEQRADGQTRSHNLSEKVSSLSSLSGRTNAWRS